MICLCVQWLTKSWQFAYWMPKSLTPEQTLADISITTRIRMCTEVKVKYWGPIPVVPVWLEYWSYAQLSRFSCLHFSWIFFSFCSLNCKFMNVIWLLMRSIIWIWILPACEDWVLGYSATHTCHTCIGICLFCFWKEVFSWGKWWYSKHCMNLRCSQLLVLTFPEVYKHCSQMNYIFSYLMWMLIFMLRRRKSTNRHE